KLVGGGKAPTIGVPCLTHANDAAGLVDIVGAAGPSSERHQVDDPGMLRPEESATTSTHHRTAVVDPERYARRCPECSEIAHVPRRRPQEGVGLASLRFRQPHHLPVTIP